MFTPGAQVPLTDADATRLGDRLGGQLDESMRNHEQLEAELNRWERAYEAQPESKTKDFPWQGACNVVIPLIGIAVDSIVARIVNTIFSITPFWSIRPLRAGAEGVAKPLESALEWSRQNEFNMYREVRKWVPDVVLYGWGYMKVPWDVRIVREFRPNQDGDPTLFERVIRRPNPHWVPIRDIITQAGMDDDLEQAEWFAHRFRLTDGTLRLRERDTGFANVDEIIKHKESINQPSEMAGTPNLSSGGQDNKERLNTMYEMSANISLLEEEGLPESTVLTLHRPTRKITRAIYNPFFHGRRPFVKAKFIERQGRIDGYGIARRLIDLQDELTTIHRQQVDNSTIANTRFFVGRRGVVKPNTRVYPGRFLTVPDPDRDVKVLQLGDTYNSMHQLAVEILAYAERASGVSDPFLGRESSVIGSRATATGTLAILQEGNRRFDLNVRDIRDALGEAGRMVLELNHQFRPRGFFSLIQGEEGRLTEKVLELPPDFSAATLAVELTASTATINRDVERQGLISLLGLLAQYYQRLMEMSVVASNPQLPGEAKALAQKAFGGATFVMQRLLQTFDVKNIDAVIPTAVLEEINATGGTSAEPPRSFANGSANGSVGGFPGVS